MTDARAIAVGDRVWVISHHHAAVGTIEKIGPKLVYIRENRKVQRYRRDSQVLNGCAYPGYCFKTFSQKDADERRAAATSALRDRFAVEIGWRRYRDFSVDHLEGLLQWLETNCPATKTGAE